MINSNGYFFIFLKLAYIPYAKRSATGRKSSAFPARLWRQFPSPVPKNIHIVFAIFIPRSLRGVGELNTEI